MNHGVGLVVWQKAKILANHVGTATDAMPKTEMYGLAALMRLAATSVVSNIAEGRGRLSRSECQQFLEHSRGSLLDLETRLEIAVEIGCVSIEEFRKLEPEVSEVRRLLDGLLDSQDVWRTAVAS